MIKEEGNHVETDESILKNVTENLTPKSLDLLRIIERLKSTDDKPVTATKLVLYVYPRKKYPDLEKISEKSFVKLKRSALHRLIKILTTNNLIIMGENETKSDYREKPLIMTKLGLRILQVQGIDHNIGRGQNRTIENEQERLKTEHKKDLDRIIDQILSYLDYIKLHNPIPEFPGLAKNIIPSEPEYQKDLLYQDLRNHLKTFLDFETFENQMEMQRNLSFEANKVWEQMMSELNDILSQALNLEIGPYDEGTDVFTEDLISWAILCLHYKIIFKDSKGSWIGYWYNKLDSDEIFIEYQRYLTLRGFGVPMIVLKDDKKVNEKIEGMKNIIREIMENVEIYNFYDLFNDLIKILHQRKEIVEQYIPLLEQEKFIKILKGKCKYLK